MIVNCVVIVACVLVVLFGKTLFREGFLDPLYDRRVSQFDALQIKPGDIVFLGDSITEEGRWSEWFPGSAAVNRGIGGDNTRGVIQRLPQISQGRPAKVFLMIGTNDLGGGQQPPEIAENIERIVSGIAEASPSTDIYVQSVLPRGAGYRDRIENLNALIQKTVGDKATWIDLYPLFLGENGAIRDDLANDELHLLGPGYKLWRESIAGYVKGA